MHELIRALNRIAHPRLLVVGDLILDRYTWGDVQRISPEAPVPIVRAEREEIRLGGAAGVAMLARALGAEVTLAGVTGHGCDGRLLHKLLRESEIDCRVVLRDPDRPTTVKERFMGWACDRRPQQILRVDREANRSLDPAIEQQLANTILEQLGGHAAVLIADYGKGVCTPMLLARMIEHAKERNVPVFVDPARICEYARYQGAALLVPNRVEAGVATACQIHTPEDALTAGAKLRIDSGVRGVLIKLDSAGMVLVSDDQSGRIFRTRPRAVCDVTGAGDMVLAMIGLCRASGLDWDDAVPLANLAAGLEVERLGVAPVTRAEICAALVQNFTAGGRKQLSLDEMEALAQTYRSADETVVFTNGCFDLLHPGHVACLEEAAGLGDILIVAVNSDRSVRKLKGPDRPLMNQADRAAMLAALDCVDHVLILDATTPHDLLRRLQPDVLVKGGTYSADEVIGREVVEQYGGLVYLTSRVEGMSTSRILAAVRSGSGGTMPDK